MKITAALVGLRHFLAPKRAENFCEQRKEVDGPKMSETLVNIRFMLIRAKSFSPYRFETIFVSGFV